MGVTSESVSVDDAMQYFDNWQQDFTLTCYSPIWNDDEIHEVVTFSKAYPRYILAHLDETYAGLRYFLLSRYRILFTVDFSRSRMILSTEWSETTKSEIRKAKELSKAKELLQVLAVVPKFPPQGLVALVYQLFEAEGKYSNIIKIGNQCGGLCSEFRIHHEQFSERIRLLWKHKDELAEITSCHIFIQENTVAIVGKTEDRARVRSVVEGCIVRNEHPAVHINAVKKKRPMMRKLMSKPLIRNDDGIIQVVNYYKRYPKSMEDNLVNDSHKLQFPLSLYKLKYNIFNGHGFMHLSIDTSEQHCNCTFRQAKELLQLLAAGIRGNRAFGLLQYGNSGIIKIGELCAEFGISNEQFLERKERLWVYKEALTQITSCRIDIQEDIVVVFGGHEGVKLLRALVKDCIVKTEYPAAWNIMTIQRKLVEDSRTGFCSCRAPRYY